MTTTEAELRTAALAAFEARRRREDQDQRKRVETAIDVLQERAGETLREALEIPTDPGDWKIAAGDVDRLYAGDGGATAIMETAGLRFAYHEARYGTGGPATELAVQHRCERCGGWFDAQDLSRGTSSYPAIERLGRYYARLEEGPEFVHDYCPAEQRCHDDACLRPDPHYGHAPTVEAAEAAEPWPVEEPAPDEEPDEPEPTADEELGAALRRWLQRNAESQAHAIGAALHEEIEQALGGGRDG